MSVGVNSCQFIGNLGKDPEIRFTPGGSAVANASLGVNEEWKDRNSGEKQSRTEWVRLVAFGRLAEVMGEYLRKGAQIYVSGRMQTRKWQGQDGQDRYTTEIVVSEMKMLGSRGQGEARGGGDGYNSPPAREPARRAPEPQRPAPVEDYDEDIPF